MADTINTIIDKQAFDQLDKLYAELDKSHKEFLGFAKDVSSVKLNFSGIKMPSDLEKQLNKTKGATEQLTTSLKEQDKIEKALISQLTKKELAQESTNRALIKARVEVQEINKEQKRQAIIASELTGEYKKQSTILNTLRDRYKDMVLSQKGGTKEAEALKNEINKLDQKLKAVDASVGQHQRSVGNYAIATENLHPALGRVNMGLQSMGTNLDDLAASKNPFKELTTAVVNFGKATMTFLLSPVGLAITAIGALFMLINRNKDTVIQFDSQLRDVGKTTGLAGKDLEGLGNDVVRLSRKLQTVGTPQLMEYAIAAGQLGVKGRKNIIAFSEALAKLETASDISGEEGARSIARLLTLTDGGTQNVKEFGDEIVNLGNNVAATEKEILSNSEAIAQNLGQYDFARKYVLAYGAATKAVGIEAEITGSTIGRTLGQFENAIRTGNNLEVLVKTTGKSAEELKAQFKDDAAGVFTDFIKGLNDIDKSGGSVNKQLEDIGITAIRDQRVLGSLATRGFGELQKSIELTASAVGSLDKEFEDASKKLEKQIGRIGTAWDNLVLTIENGQGVFGKFFGWLAGFGADAIENFTQVLQFSAAIFAGLVEVAKQAGTEIAVFLQNLAAFSEIEIDLLNPSKMASDVKKALGNITTQIKTGGERAGNAFMEGFGSTIASMEKGKVEIGGSETSEDYGGLDEEADKLRTLADINRDLAAAREELLNSNKNTRDGIKEKIKLLEEEAAAWSDQNKKLVQREKDEIAWVEKKNKVLEGSVGYYENLKSALQNHQKNLATTSKEYAQLEANIQMVEKTIEIVSGTFDQLKPLKLTADEQLEIDDFLNTEGITKGMVALSNTLGVDHNALMKEFKSQYEWDYEQFKKFSEKKMEQAELEKSFKLEKLGEWFEYSSNVLYEVGNLASAIGERRIQKYEEQIAANNEMYDAILNNEETTEQQREDAEKEKEKRNEALKKKADQERTKQAKIAKATAALSIAINTAAAIIGALAPPPVGLGPIAGIPISIAMGAIGAIQLATVLATPIPAYAEGKKSSDTYEGPMLYGEAGPEAKIDKNGNVEIATKPTLSTTKKGDTIMPLQDFQSLTMDQIVRASIMTSMAHQGQKLSNAEVRQEFDFNLLTTRIDEGIKKGFSKIKINNNIDNNNSALLSELKRQRRKNV